MFTATGVKVMILFQSSQNHNQGNIKSMIGVLSLSQVYLIRCAGACDSGQVNKKLFVKIKDLQIK